MDLVKATSISIAFIEYNDTYGIFKRGERGMEGVFSVPPKSHIYPKSPPIFCPPLFLVTYSIVENFITFGAYTVVIYEQFLHMHNNYFFDSICLKLMNAILFLRS